MGAKENLQRLADRKAHEIEELEHQIDMARVYLQAIQDSIKALPRDISLPPNGEETSTELRSGTLLARAKEAIQKNGAPMHIGEILKAIGIENTKKARVSLVGSLGFYVRKGMVFARTAPNTFGLIGMRSLQLDQNQLRILPEEFGKVSEQA